MKINPLSVLFVARCKQFDAGFGSRGRGKENIESSCLAALLFDKFRLRVELGGITAKQERFSLNSCVLADLITSFNCLFAISPSIL